MTEADLVVRVPSLHVRGEALRSRVSVRLKGGTARLARTNTGGLAEPSRFPPTTRQSSNSRDCSMTGWTNAAQFRRCRMSPIEGRQLTANV